MRLRLTILFCFLIPSVALGQGAQLTGTWKGYWTRAGDTMAITMVVQRDTMGHHTATFDSERFRVSGIPFVELRTEGCCAVTLVLQGDRTTTVFKGQLRGDSLTGSFREGASEGHFAYSRAMATTPSFEERDITFQSGGVTLAGTLFLPRVQGRVPTVRIYPGADHTFRLQPGSSGWSATAPAYLPSLLRWLAQRC